MQKAMALIFALLAITGAQAAQTNPLAKVMELIDSLSAKIIKEGEAEQKAYEEFVEWCDDAARNKQFEIKTAASKKEELEAAIAKSASDVESAGAKIEELAGALASSEDDLKAATKVRETEAADFSKNEAELMDVIDTLGRAIQTLEREMAKNPAFAQMDSSSLRGLLQSLGAVADAAAFSASDKQHLLELVQQRQGSDADEDEFGAPAAAVYKSHSGGIVDILEDMKEKAEEQLSGLRKAEQAAQHNYNMLKQSLEDQMAADKKDLEETKAEEAASKEAKAVAEGDLTETIKELTDATDTLKSTSSSCMQTAADHEATIHSRNEELAAIGKAKEILSSTTSGAEGQAYSFMQVGAVSSMSTRADLANAEVVNLLKKVAKEQHSSALTQLASRVSAVLRYGAGAGEDVFAKVKGLIRDMIEKLEAEAGEEATEKAYCDEQMAKTEEKKGELEHDISKLTAKIDKSAAKSAELKAEVKQLQDELATLAKEQAAMDKARMDEKSAFTQAKADLELGLSGVRKALSVLREYYGGSALLQQPAAPEQHAAAAGAGAGIIGMLEVVESDFAKNLAAAETEEDGAQAEYDKTTQANKVTKTLKDQDVKYKSQEAARLDKTIAELTGDRETADAELSAVLDYYAKIKERCIAKPESYETRKARREAEIAGLKEALSILQDEAALLQRGKRNLRHQYLGL